MRGFLKILRSSNLVRIAALLTFSGFSFWGCGSSEAPRHAEAPEESLKEFVERYEKTFRPSSYEVDVKLVRVAEAEQYNALHSAPVYTTAATETIPGFRVQVLLTQEIDDATSALNTLEQQLPEDYAYIAYDAPYYKVRIGNFSDRTSANSTMKKLLKLGYKDSWVVPDNVLKNPPPKLPDASIEPKRYIDKNR